MVSYAFIGPVWRPGPITWSFADFTYPVDQASFSFSDPLSLTPSAQAEVAQAIQEWARVSGLTFQQVADTPDPNAAADIRIGFGKFDIATTGEIGETKVYLGQYSRPDTIVRMEDPTEIPLVPVNGQLVYTTAGGTPFFQVALHEIGHALGLDHSSSPTDVMYPVATAQNRTLSASDIAGIRALYPPPSVQLHGLHTDYVIAQVSGGQAYIQDTRPGRDGVQTLARLDRIDFADGTGLFDPAGTAEDVARLYQAAFGRAPDAPGLDSNTALITANTLSLAALAASFAASPEFNALYGQPDASGFARQLYLNVLHRNPDAAGQQLWVNYINATSRGDALLAFSDSQENHRQTLPIAGSRSDAETTRLYQAAFNRSPDSAGLAFWSGRLSQDATVDQVAQGFVDSPEFAASYGVLNASGFVAQLYANVLHRAPDAAGQQGWLNTLTNGGTRAVPRCWPGSPTAARTGSPPRARPMTPGSMPGDQTVSVPARARSYRAATASQSTTSHHAAR